MNIDILQSIAEGELPFTCRHVFQIWLLKTIKSESYTRAVYYHELKNAYGSNNAVLKVAEKYHVSKSTVFRDYAKHKRLLSITQ